MPYKDHLLNKDDITRSILETVGALVLVLDSEGRIVYFNPACQQLSGYCEEEALGRTPWDFLLPKDVCMSVRGVFSNLLGGDFPNTHENAWLTKDGNERIISWSNSATLNEDQSVRYVIATGIDITDRANLQNQLEQRVEKRTRELVQANRKLVESETRLSRAQAITSLGNWEWNIKTGGLIWSDEIYRIFGRQPQEFAPTYEAFLNTIHPEDRRRVSDAVNEAIEDSASYSIIHRIVCPDGSEKVVQEIGMVIRETDGTPVRMDGTVQDITRDWHSREALIMASRAASDASRAKSEFLASMSHELRTPLNAVLGFAEIMLYDTKSPPSARQINHIRHIADGGNHLLNLVNEILDLARIESGHLDLSLEDVNANKAVAECIALTLPLGEARQIRIVDEFSESSPARLHTDQLRLTQVLVNLLSNAIKYNRVGGAVTIRGHKIDSNFLRISVMDTGIGIARKDHAGLFQMFHRLDPSDASKPEGTGVGLATTKALVENMDGRIGFESEEGVGSTFWIELPLASTEAALA